MDPVSILGLSSAIQQLLGCIIKYGQGVREAKREINQLCSELLGLKAALEHVELVSQSDGDPEADENARSLLSSSNLSTPEFQYMLSFTKNILTELLERLETKGDRFQSSLQRLKWPLIKDDVKLYIQRLERSKQWFILATTSENLMLSKESYLKICSIDQRLKLQQEFDERRRDASSQEAVKRWLAPCDPYPVFRTSLSAFQEGTGKWFLDDVLQGWLDGRCRPILWLLARPGVGKTTILSAAIDRVQLQERHGSICGRLSFFFCSFTDQQSQDLQNIFGSLLVQLCEAHPKLWREINDRHAKEMAQSSQKVKKLDSNELIDLIIHCADHLQGAIIILDALNETRQSSNLLQLLLHMTQRTKYIKILISSTEELGLGKMGHPITTVSVRKEQTARDIVDYIDKILQDDEVFHHIPGPLKKDIKLVLCERASGNFRWVQCQLETLREQGTPREMRHALQSVPSTLETTYRNILRRVNRHEVQKTKRALFWITFSLRPLTFAELCEAVIIPKNGALIDDDMRLLRPEGLLRSCSSLISYDNTTKRITLAHSSVMQYLTSVEIERSDVSDFFLDEETADTDIATRCVDYLCSPAFSSGYCPSKREFTKRLEGWPLLPYIARTFFNHLSYVTLDDQFTPRLLQFFRSQAQPRGANFGAWVQAFNPGSPLSNIQSSTPLYYAARFGLLPIVKVLLEVEGTKHLETPGGVYGSTPLHVAAWQGHTAVVRELLNAGANAREVNQIGEPGLSWAVSFGYKDIEKMLRDAGACFESWMNLEELEYGHQGIEKFVLQKKKMLGNPEDG